MRLDFSNAEQITAFLMSVLLGASLCILYDFVRVWHKVHSPGKVAVFIVDVLCFFVSGVITFCFFILYCKGQLRIYVFAGEIIGATVCRFTLSKYFYKVLLFADNLIVRTVLFILKPVNRFAVFSVKKAEIIYGAALNRSKGIKKYIKIIKFGKKIEKNS